MYFAAIIFLSMIIKSKCIPKVVKSKQKVVTMIFLLFIPDHS